ncbi:MAG TPA: DUF5711 family protein, partial [Candidatus Bathyarchaeia archaeon]|nr:DUF5711 family protein [Candidatus Bathyarchaeia archaeon]
IVTQPTTQGQDTILSLFNSNSSDPFWNYTLQHNGTVWESTSISDDGGYLLVSGDYTTALGGAGLFSRSSNKPVWTVGNYSSGYPPPWFDGQISGNGQYTILLGQKLGYGPQSSIILSQNPTMTPLWYFNTSFYNARQTSFPLSISHEGAYVAIVDPGGNTLGSPRLSVFSQHDNHTLWTSNANWVNAVISGNGDRVVAATNTAISVFGLNSNQTLFTITSPSVALRVSQDGSTLAVLSGSYTNLTLQVYDLITGLELFSANANSEAPLQTAISADGSRIALFNGSQLFVYGRTGNSICETTVGGSSASLEISGDGQSIALGGRYLSYVKGSFMSLSAQEILFLESIGAAAIVTGAFASVLLLRRYRRHQTSQAAVAN